MLKIGRSWQSKSVLDKCIAGALISLLVCVCAGLASGNWSGFSSMLQTGVLAATACILVWYAWETRRMAQTTEAMLDIERQADVRAWLVDRGDGLGGLALIVVNAGRNAARDVDVLVCAGQKGSDQRDPLPLRGSAGDYSRAGTWWWGGVIMPGTRLEGLVLFEFAGDCKEVEVHIEWTDARAAERQPATVYLSKSCRSYLPSPGRTAVAPSKCCHHGPVACPIGGCPHA